MAEPVNVQTVQVPIRDLRFADYNPRRMMREEGEALKRSLTEFGPVEPAVVNKDGTIIGGHMRIAAARDLGWEMFPVVYVDLPERQAKLLNLALNRISGEWDEDKLAQLLWELNEQEGPGDILELSGFGAAELESALDEVGGPEPEPPVPDEAEQVVEPGDVWQLGQHFLACGDSADERLVTKLFEVANEVSVDLIFTSPPYNVGMEYGEHDDTIKDWPSYEEFLSKCLRPWIDRLGSGRALGWQIGDAPSVYPHRQLAMLEEVFGLIYFRTMVWDKVGIGVPLWYMTEREKRARYFTPDYQHELVYLCSKGELEVGPQLERLDSTVQHSLVRVASATATRDVPDAGGERTRYRKLDRHGHKVHQAVFPVQLAKGFCVHLAGPGETVADPFCGVGSTLIACERADRRGIGMELDPSYCDVALERYSQAFEAEPVRRHRKRPRKRPNGRKSEQVEEPAGA